MVFYKLIGICGFIFFLKTRSILSRLRSSGEDLQLATYHNRNSFFLVDGACVSYRNNWSYFSPSSFPDDRNRSLNIQYIQYCEDLDDHQPF